MQNLSRLFFLTFFLSWVHCGSTDPSELSANRAEQLSHHTNVSSQIIQLSSLTQFSRLPTTVEAWQDATIGALESGVVSALHKDLGDQVSEGEILAELKLDVLEDMAIEAEAGLKFQAYNLAHSQKLMAEGSISEQAHFATEYEFGRAQSNALAIRTRLGFGQIRAPFEGRIAERFVDLGQLLGQGSPVFRLVQIDRVRIKIWVSEQEIVDFEPGGPVTVTLDPFPGIVFPGSIGRLGSAADTKRRVFPIEVDLDNPDGRILPGMIGKAQILRHTFDQVVVVPREAVLERETGSIAFIAQNNRAVLRRLVLGPAEGDRVVVLEGLKPGEELIISGNRDLIDGDPVLVKTRESDK